MRFNINIVGHFDIFNGDLCATIDKKSTERPDYQNQKVMREKVKWIYGVKMIAITATECVAKKKKWKEKEQWRESN